MCDKSGIVMTIINPKISIALLLLLIMSLSAAAENVDIENQEFINIGDKQALFENIEIDGDYLSNINSDGYIIINDIDLPRSKVCSLLISLEFKSPMKRPGVFDVYWKTKEHGFTEQQKGFFIISHKDTITPKHFVIPLCKLYNFSGNLNRPEFQQNIDSIRFDYPASKNISLKINKIEFLTNIETQLLLNKTTTVEYLVVEPYEWITGKSFTSLDLIMPKLMFALEDGVRKIIKDIPFLIFWVSLVVVLKLLIVVSIFHGKN